MCAQNAVRPTRPAQPESLGLLTDHYNPQRPAPTRFTDDRHPNNGADARGRAARGLPATPPKTRQNTASAQEHTRNGNQTGDTCRQGRPAQRARHLTAHALQESSETEAPRQCRAPALGSQYFLSKSRPRSRGGVRGAGEGGRKARTERLAGAVTGTHQCGGMHVPDGGYLCIGQRTVALQSAGPSPERGPSRTGVQRIQRPVTRH